ncbi:Hypothetical predicted protein [Marmota monax]|uniref:Uncharacterized protein n=1 Tax=Marmota monax TaxID=9995 RepID=A0A5E4APP9_MARMO|nr:Hypothetical predicted protein [Marmota monax]
MLSGPGSLARGPHPTSPRQDGHGSPGGPQAEAPIKEAHGEALGSLQQSPNPGHSPESAASHPGGPAQPSQQKARGSPGPLPTPKTQSTGSGVAAGPLARLGRRREARLPFSRFLDEVAVRVLDPGTLEAFRGPRGLGAAPTPEAQGPGLAQEPLAGTATPEEEEAAPSPQLSSEAAAGAVRGVGPGQAEETRGPCVGSDEHGGPSASPWRPPGPVSAPTATQCLGRQPTEGQQQVVVLSSALSLPWGGHLGCLGRASLKALLPTV